MLTFILGSLLGVLLGFLWKAREYIQNGSFSLPIWWEENKFRSLWSIAVVLLLNIVTAFFPQSLAALSFIGFNLGGDSISDVTNLSPVLLGTVTMYATYSKNKEKQIIE